MSTDKIETFTTPGFKVACMTCHNGKPHVEYTPEAAHKWAEIHLSVTEKPHWGHEVTITPTQIVRLKK